MLLSSVWMTGTSGCLFWRPVRRKPWNTCVVAVFIVVVIEYLIYFISMIWVYVYSPSCLSVCLSFSVSKALMLDFVRKLFDHTLPYVSC